MKKKLMIKKIDWGERHHICCN